jgi:hypothetical protein
MPCYCNDIRKIDKDIQTLNSMIAKLNAIAGKDSAQTSLLNRLSGSAVSSVTPDNIQTLAEKTGRLNAKIADNRSAMTRRVTNEINSLRNRLSSLQTADKNYHNSLLVKGR